jgi:hypothetical protein
MLHDVVIKMVAVDKVSGAGSDELGIWAVDRSIPPSAVES